MVSRCSSVGGLVSIGICLLALMSHGPSSSVKAWGADGHHIICNIAEKLLNPIALAAVEELLPDVVDGNLSDLCSWADDVRHQKGYSWSAPLHYIDTPDDLCNYNPIRDCRNGAGTPNYCASGAISNYTEQLKMGTDKYNLTESLLFLAHIVGDIHQPLHVGFEGDKGGNQIEVYWFNTRTNLHHVWDTNMLFEDEDQYYDGDISALTKSLYDNATGVWSRDSAHWSVCAGGETVCPDVYASESIRIACEWAYSDAISDATLGDEYFQSRLPVLQKRVAQAGGTVSWNFEQNISRRRRTLDGFKTRSTDGGHMGLRSTLSNTRSKSRISLLALPAGIIWEASELDSNFMNS